jgi:hypothetical protein
MSTMNDLLQRATELVASLKELLDSEAAQALPGIAKELDATAILNAGVDALVLVLGTLHQGLEKLGQTAITEMNALVGLMGMLAPLVDALGNMIGAAGDELASYGLDKVVVVTEPVSQGFGYATTVLSVGRSLIVGSDMFADLVEQLAVLQTRVDALGFPREEPQQLAAVHRGGVA